jgi:hypothetical protein
MWTQANSKGRSINTPGMITHTCNPSTLETEAGGWWIWSQPGLHRKILSKRKKERKKRERQRERERKSKYYPARCHESISQNLKGAHNDDSFQNAKSCMENTSGPEPTFLFPHLIPVGDHSPTPLPTIHSL